MTRADAIALVFIAAMTFGVTWWQMAAISADVTAAETCGFNMGSASRFVFCTDGPQ